MRHDSVKDRNEYDIVEVAAVWPATAQLAPLPIPELTERADSQPAAPAPAAPDVPAAAGFMIIASYVALLAALTLATAASGQSIFAIVIAAFFLFMFFSVPAVFLSVDAGQRRGRSFRDFLDRGMQTYTGHCGGGAALVQMLMVPVLLTFGIICMGITAAVIF